MSVQYALSRIRLVEKRKNPLVGGFVPIAIINLHRRVVEGLEQCWWEKRDLNPRPTAYQTGALPTELLSQNLP